MKKYRLQCINNNTILRETFTYKENAQKSCDEINNRIADGGGVLKFRVVEVETGIKKMTIEERANWLYEHHKDEYITAKEEIIANMSDKDLKRQDKSYLIWFRVTRKLKHLLPNYIKYN